MLYRSIFDVVRDFLHDEALGGEDKVLARYLKPDLVIVDDMGMKQLPRRSGECLFEIIMRRYENRSTMMTSNRPLEDWGKLIGDVPSATAILDRFLHHARSSPSPARATGCETRTRSRPKRMTAQNQPTCRPGPVRKRKPNRRPPTPPTRRRSLANRNAISDYPASSPGWSNLPMRGRI